MINTIVIEDQKQGGEGLAHSLSGMTNDVYVTTRLGSVRESIEYLSRQPVADLIFSDIQLEDGLAFEIFKQQGIRIPIIFITGYDKFMLNVFEYNCIDYITKPVDKESLEKALNKYRALEKHFTNHNAINRLLRNAGNHKKKRIIVRKRLENISLRLEDVVIFYTKHKIVHVIDRLGNKYLANTNLGELEEELDSHTFFRANRQYIVNINFIRGYKSYERVKLMVELTLPELNHTIIVSQETAPLFRKWILL